jgi:hypothetical protein
MASKSRSQCGGSNANSNAAGQTQSEANAPSAPLVEAKTPVMFGMAVVPYVIDTAARIAQAIDPDHSAGGGVWRDLTVLMAQYTVRQLSSAFQTTTVYDFLRVKPTASEREIADGLQAMTRHELRVSRKDNGAHNSRIVFAGGLMKADRRAAYDQWLARGYLTPREGSPPPVAYDMRYMRAPASNEVLSDWHHQTAWNPLKSSGV